MLKPLSTGLKSSGATQRIFRPGDSLSTRLSHRSKPKPVKWTSAVSLAPSRNSLQYFLQLSLSQIRLECEVEGHCGPGAQHVHHYQSVLVILQHKCWCFCN